MKKIYIIVAVMLLSITSYGQTPIITGIMDGDCDQGRPKVLEIYADGAVDFSAYSLEKQVNAHTDWEATYDLSALGTVTDAFVYLYDEHPDFTGIFAANFPSASNTYDLSDSQVLEFNGDDRVRIINTSSGTTIDQYGESGVDGTDTLWEYKDGYGKRNSGTSANGGGFVATNWLNGNGLFNGEGTCQSGITFESIFVIGTFTPGSSSDPSLVITSPINAVTLNPEAAVTMDVTFVVQNFNVANGSGDGHITYKVDSAAPIAIYDTNPINITSIGTGAHNIIMELVDNSGNPLSPPVSTSTGFIIESYNDVGNLEALRSGIVGQYYRVTGEVLVTFSQDYRGQKWVQDDSAGIKIDDNDHLIATTYNVGDGIVDLRGKLGSYHDLLQLIPTADPGLNSSGHTITPEPVSLADIAANIGIYESTLVLVTAATIADYDDGGSGDADGTFQTGKIYPLTDASTTGVLRTNFYDADYIGSALPSTARNYACIVDSYDGDVRVTPRSLDDIIGVNSLDAIIGFSLYPNPVTNGILTINTRDSLSKSVKIFDVLGKQVLSLTTSKSTVDVASLKRGIYIIKVEEAGKIATRKLMIK